MKKIKLGIVGLGYWGPKLVRNFLSLKTAQIEAVCDLNNRNLVKIKQAHPHLKVTKNYDDLLNNQEVEALVIATPVGTHFSLAKKALEHDKHVLVEKPFTKTSREAQVLINLAKEKKKVLMVDYTFLYTAAVQKIKSIITKKDLGKLYYFSSERLNLGRLQSDVDVIWDLASHDLSILNYLIPYRILSISARGIACFNKQFAELVQLTLKFSHNFSAYLYLSWLSPIKVRQILIGGAKKMLLYNDLAEKDKVKVFNTTIKFKKNHLPIYLESGLSLPKLTKKEALQTLCQHFIDCLQKKQKPLTDGQFGLKVIKILEAATKSLKNQGKEIRLN